eukprot:gene12309-2957_t
MVILDCLLGASAEAFTFAILASNSSRSKVAANQSVIDLNTAYSNMTFKLDIYDPLEKKVDLLDLGSQLLQRNTSILVRVSGKERTAIFVSDVLRTQTVETWKRSQTSWTALSNSISMVASMKENSEVIVKIVKRLQLLSVSIIYQNSRNLDMDTLSESLAKENVAQHYISIDCKSDGTVEEHAYDRLKSIVTEKSDGIVVIYDEEKLQKLFDSLKIEYIGIQAVPSTFIIYDPIAGTALEVGRAHTVIALQVSLENTEKSNDFYNAVEKVPSDGRSMTEHALIYDAVMTAGNSIARLNSRGKWNKYSGTLLQRTVTSAANALILRSELTKFKSFGLTGNLEFESNGFRKKMPFQIMGLKKNNFTKIGYIDENGVVSLLTAPQTNFNYETLLKVNGHLKVVTIEDAPFTMKETLSNGTVKYHGFLIDILDKIAEEANFTYTLYEVADGKYGHLEDGRWRGIVGDVLYKKADMALGMLTITSVRQEVVHFNTPFMEVSIGFVTKKEQAAHVNLLLFMEPFSGAVWGLVLTACIFIGVFLYSIDACSPYGGKQTGEKATGRPGTEFDIMNSIWFSVASILLQGPDNTPRSLSGRLLVGGFWFYVLILTSSYTANLAAFFTSTKAKSQLLDLETVLKNGHQFTVVKDTALEQFLSKSDYQVYSRVYERMVALNDLSHSTDDATKRVRETKNMYYLEEKPFIKWKINEKPCDLELTDTSLPKSSFGMPVRKDSPLKDAITHAILKVTESGYLKKREQYYTSKLSECSDPEDESSSNGITADGRIEPIQMLGAYSFLIGGTFIAVCALLAEIFWKKKVEERAAKAKARFKKLVQYFLLILF